uniref:Ornithine decarboxylase n=1 Tax=Neogobius melanostomus TaxID=47308 RepID=A0A8C6SY49_9GOBI
MSQVCLCYKPLIHSVNVETDLQSMETSRIEVLEVNKNSETFIDDKIKDEVPFYVGNLDSVFEKHQKWQTLLPRVTPFYAVNALGTGFDCASKRELEMVMSIGVTPDKIIYAHTTKPQTHIRYACAQGVDMMTFDNEEELLKITRGHPNAKLLLRIAVDDSKSQVKLSTKFGATLGTVGSLLKRANELDLDVKGVSFHVGSLCTDSVAYRWAIEEAHHVFEQAVRFSGHGLECGVRVIAEPGRYFVDSAFTLALNVFARKKVWSLPISQKDGNGLDTMIMYYVTDGLHGAFGINKLHPDIKPFVLRPHRVMKPRYQSVIWGPTCDSADRIMDVWMPELNIGDWILVDNVGAYTIQSSTGLYLLFPIALPLSLIPVSIRLPFPLHIQSLSLAYVHISRLFQYFRRLLPCCSQYFL